MGRRLQHGDSHTTRPRFSVRNRVVAGLLTMVTAFSVLLAYSIVLYRSTVADLSLINTTYLPLTLGTSDIRATQLVFNTLMDRLADEPDQSVTRGWIDAARRYRPVVLNRLIRLIDEPMEREIPEDEAEFLSEMGRRLEQVRSRYRANERKFSELYGLMDSGREHRARLLIEDLKRSERLLDRVLAGIGEEVEGHITEVADNAEVYGGRATWGLALLTLMAALTGVAVVFTTNRLLLPLRDLQRAVARVAGGDLSTRTEVARADEIGALASDFNSMTDALAERDKRLIRSERLATAGKMAAQVTHEIRNPLSSLGLNADLLEEELSGGEASEPAEARGLLRAIQEEIERLTDITEAYLRFARLPAPSLEPTDLNEVVEDAVGFMRPEIEARDVRLDTSLGSGLESIPIDGGQVRRALINLLRNSAEALEDSGEIRVDTIRRGAEAHLSVSDDGPGVPEKNREQIFETFYSTKSSGTGLGLPMVRQIALAHGGDVHYENNESAGGGSRFVVVLPTALSKRGEEGDDGEKKES